MRPGAPTSKSTFLWRISPFDIILAIIAPFLALSLRDPGLLEIKAGADSLPNSYHYAALTIAFSIPAFLLFRLSDGMTRFLSSHDVLAVFGATLAIVACSSVTLFVFNRLDGVPRSTPLIYGLLLAGGLVSGRAIARFGLVDRWLKADGEVAKPQLRRVIIIGVDRFAALAIKLTDCQVPRTTQIVAALDRRERLKGRTVNGVKIVGRPSDLEAVLEEYLVHGLEIDEVWQADHSLSQAETARVERACRALGAQHCAISHALNLAPEQTPRFSHPSHDAQIATPHAGYFRFKRAIDAMVASILIVLLAPLMLLVAGLTYLDVGGPVIFWQRRIGHGGREFLLFKFRTYRAPFAKDGAAIAKDLRLSRIGKAIRATRLDETPQLFNMLRGDMSLIGPRPLLPVDQPKDPTLRLLVRPGVTGWAQVNGGTQVTAEEKDALDVWYIHHASLALDAKIILRTMIIVFRGENVHCEAIATALQWRTDCAAILPLTTGQSP